MSEMATFAAGCFWGVENLFRNTPGVLHTRVGYTGGHTKNPSYNEVCSHTTGHAEAVEIEFDPVQISYEKLLHIFFNNHTPTTLNQQGPDIGSQYRSAIFYHNDEQRKLALQAKQQLQVSGKYSVDIVTEIVPATTFYPAEDYHQQYLEKHGMASCSLVSQLDQSK